MRRLSRVGSFVALLLLSSAAVAQCDTLSDASVTTAPYSAVRRIITIKRNSDGTSSRSVASQEVARDSSGRSYKAGERRWTTKIDGKLVEKSEVLVSIFDPVADTETRWDTSSKVAKVVHYRSSNNNVEAHQPRVDAFSFDALAKSAHGKALGTRTIDGLSVEGIGYKTSNSTHECWYSRELNVVVLQTDEYHDSSFTDRLKNIRRGEPDVSRYTPPPTYSINRIDLDKPY